GEDDSDRDVAAAESLAQESHDHTAQYREREKSKQWIDAKQDRAGCPGKADVRESLGGEGQAAQNDEEPDHRAHDGHDRSRRVGVLHEVVLKRLGNHVLVPPSRGWWVHSSGDDTNTRPCTSNTSTGDPYKPVSTSDRITSWTEPIAARPPARYQTRSITPSRGFTPWVTNSTT